MIEINKLNFAIIGYGSIGKTHALAAYDANIRYPLPYQLNLTHIVTRKPIEVKLQGVKNVTDIQQVLDDPNVDFVDICTPNDSHMQIVEKAAAYGKPVYCEKPLASTYKEALQMVQIVNQKNLIHGIAFMYRFLPSIRLLKYELQKETIGQVIDFKIKTYHKSYLNDNKKDTWRIKKNSGGGALLDLGVHLIDLIQFTLDDIKETEYKASIYFKERTEVDEISRCDCILNNGITGTLEVSRIFAERKQTDDYVIYGTKGSIKVSLDNPYEIEIYKYESSLTEIKNASHDQELMKYYAGQRNSLGFFQNCHTASLIHFANKVYGEGATSIGADFEDGLKCQRIIERLYNI